MGENAEYETAMNELAFLEGRVQELEAMIQNAVIIPNHKTAKGRSTIVGMGSIVKVESAQAKRPTTYTIVGSAEASPSDGRISNESPIGKALIGKKVGDEVEFAVPAGKQRLKVLQVRYPSLWSASSGRHYRPFGGSSAEARWPEPQALNGNAMTQRGDELLHSRQVKLAALRARGVDPYPPDFRRRHTTSQAVAKFEAAEAKGEERGPTTAVAGRIIRLRDMGRASFVDVEDSSGRIQLFLRANALGAGYQLLEQLDLGDFVGARGTLIRTRMGEVSVEVSRVQVLAKAIRPPPDDYYGLHDQETRYRQRYLDLIANRPVHEVMRARSRIVSALRRYFDSKGFVEVETPVLVAVPAGAMAEPFVTQHHALDRRLYLRIATELNLKRLIVGGMDKVYEIGRVFRNEGIDRDHNPEFTLLESYEAYADYRTVMRTVEALVPFVAKRALGTTSVEFGGTTIELKGPWPRVSLRDALREHAGFDLDEHPTAESMAGVLAARNVVATYAESRGRLIDKALATFVEPKLIQPTFLVDYPTEMSPLAKAKTSDPRYTERFEAFAGGMEIANAFSELNDPVVQRERLEEQEELRRQYQGEELDRIDDDYIVALEHGMPPTGGLGIGVDRLVMLLLGQHSIRDVVLFPQVRSIEE